MTTDTKNKKETPKKTLKQKGLSLLKSVLVYGSIFFIVYTAVNWWRQPVMPANPQLQLIDYKRQVIDLSAMSADKPLLVYFWGTWCSICSITSPAINELANENNYSVVSIAVKSGSDQQLHEYLNEQGYSFTTVNDQHGEIFTDWQGQVTPSYIILKDNKMMQGLTGIQPLWSLKLRLWLSSTF